MEYETDIVENLLRNYYMLQSHTDTEYLEYKIDLEAGLKTLQEQSKKLYYTVVNVFICGNPIQEQALNDGVTTRQVARRLHDGLYLLTLFMNGKNL